MTNPKGTERDEQGVTGGGAVGQVVEAFLHEAFQKGFGPPPPDSDQPLAYGFHPLYQDLAGRGKSVALHNVSAAFAVMPVPSYTVTDAHGACACILRPEIVHPREFWRSLRCVARATDVALIVKSVAEQEAKEAVEAPGVRSYRSNEGWSPVARWDEQSFPEVILDLNRRGARSVVLPNTEFHECSPADALRLGRRAADRWMDWYLLRRQEFPRVDLQSYYNHALRKQALYRADFRFVCLHLGEPAGFAYASRISDRQVDVWVCLAAGEPPLLSREFLRYLRRFFAEQGFSFLGLGGSELRSLYHFKRRLAGRRLVRRTHLVVTG